jgi:hypothetical protein
MVATISRKKSWKRYDDKRKGTEERLKKERARSAMRGVPKSGRCEYCNTPTSTVWHHTDYNFPSEAVELCHKCHRAEHPR